MFGIYVFSVESHDGIGRTRFAVVHEDAVKARAALFEQNPHLAGHPDWAITLEPQTFVATPGQVLILR